MAMLRIAIATWLLAAGCGSTRPSSAPWDQCDFASAGAASPDVIADAVAAYLVDHDVAHLTPFVPGRCEYMALTFDISDATTAERIVRAMRDPEGDLRGVALEVDTTRPLPRERTAELGCVDPNDRVPCTIFELGLREDAQLVVSTAPIAGRWFLVAPLFVRGDLPGTPEPAIDPSAPPLAEKTGAYDYTVSRSTIAAASADAPTQARAVPHYEQNMQRGTKLVGVRPGSIFRALGIRSGDVLRAVDGAPLTAGITSWFEAMMTRDTVVLEITRRGQPKTLTYTITDP